ncbi:SpoIIE family protein phosphatase [Natranaerobius thermophilus]|uniref:Protein serine/threonine phosphatase n=1 Tax=Natranaerobius thermophilus (strain ATCC BAA-1301 / DSM 18059 / JW/NM-WN-LF) TaxID=457570 RepID=B2A7U2_NATTJ|nr:SpoIIE family protein phosphatase [Natranaerobius thermophilus]ACB84423.1 protein serine/threonine phosphatase [Natranaerobius thermophilus JW/NM-WN-LF]
MGFFIDYAYDFINKKNEELCGDNIEVIETEENIIIILSDGLGSGVKANILATMTTKIAGTMLKGGATVYETVETIASTLPVCNVRKLAYSTFAILKISKNGKVHIVEYDNPPVFFIRNGGLVKLNKKEQIIHGKKILESKAQLIKGDSLILVSDGVIHAGVGEVLTLGWKWENVAKYLIKQSKIEECAKVISRRVVDTSNFFFNQRPGDDISVAVVKARETEVLQVFSGPPKNKKDDPILVQKILQSKGKKIVCGGTAANIVSRETGKDIKVDIQTGTNEVPPVAKMEGLDLVTEGVLTLTKVLKNIDEYLVNTHLKESSQPFKSKDGATRLTKMFIKDCTHINFYVGQAINPAHQNPDLPNLGIKTQVIKSIAERLENMGKQVTIEYY